MQEYYPSEAEIKLYECIGNYLQREGTYGIPERQRPLLSLLVRKIMASSSYALAYTLERFIQRLEEYKTTGYPHCLVYLMILKEAMMSMLSVMTNRYQ